MQTLLIIASVLVLTFSCSALAQPASSPEERVKTGSDLKRELDAAVRKLVETEVALAQGRASAEAVIAAQAKCDAAARILVESTRTTSTIGKKPSSPAAKPTPPKPIPPIGGKRRKNKREPKRKLENAIRELVRKEIALAMGKATKDEVETAKKKYDAVTKTLEEVAAQ